jgi:hypothetical protein
MARHMHGSSDRFRVGRVTVFLHHGAWWVYDSEGARRVRRKVSGSRVEAERVAAQVNSEVVQGAPTMLSFQPVGVPELCRQFLDYHEHVLRSSLGTLRRYRAATRHLEVFACKLPRPRRRTS